MAQEDRKRLVEWLEIVRAQVPIVREQIADWAGEVRQQPGLLWETPAVRYATYLTGGMLLLWIGIGVTRTLAPVPSTVQVEATTADFHVVCTDPACGRHFVIHKKFGFRDFPVACPACRKQTGAQARPCNTPACGGRWVVPTRRDGGDFCPWCGGRFK